MIEQKLLMIKTDIDRLTEQISQVNMSTTSNDVNIIKRFMHLAYQTSCFKPATPLSKLLTEIFVMA